VAGEDDKLLMDGDLDVAQRRTAGRARNALDAFGQVQILQTMGQQLSGCRESVLLSDWLGWRQDQQSAGRSHEPILLLSR
jgi:hypothetical protein